MGETYHFNKSLLSGLLVSFLLLAVFAVLFGGASQVEAADAVIGDGCGAATGKDAGVSGLELTDSTKNWKPISVGETIKGRWVDGTLTITGSSAPGDIGKKGTVSSNTANTITVSPAWNPAGSPTGSAGTISYTVTAKPNACRAGAGDAAKDYPCLQIGDIGYCKGPCSAATGTTECNKFVVGGAFTVGWGGAKCTGTPAVGTTPAVDGVCLELPRSESKLPDTAPATTGAGLLTLVDTATNWVFAIFTVLAIIFVLLAAFQFITGGGDEAKIGEARQKLIWAAVGIIIALLAKGLVPVIRAIVGG